MKTKRLIQFAIIIATLFSAQVSLFGQSNPSFPLGWDFVETPNAHGMIVFLEANPSINDYLLQPGDFIGAFYVDDFGNLKCAGADYWLENENIIFPIFGNDPQTSEKDGFGYAEVMQFRVFSQFTQKEYNVDELGWDNSYPNSNKWYPMGLSAIVALSCSVEFDVFVSASANPACYGQVVQLTATQFAGTPEGVSYSWWSEPAGFSSDQQSVSVIPDGTTTYYLTATDGINSSEHQKQIVVNFLPEVECGSDITICTEDCAQLYGEGINYSEVLWTTSGDGGFTNPAILNPNYTLGPMDIQNGFVTATMTALPMNPCDIAASGEQNITILPLPTMNIAEIISFCETQEILLSAGASNFSEILWTTQGDGTFENPTMEETVYYPGASDLSSRSITMNVCANALEPLTYQLCRQIVVGLQQKPVVNSPTSRMVCSNDALFVNSVAARHTSVLWTTSGDGTFENPESNNSYYYPGLQDKLNGNAVLTIYAFGQATCQTYPATSNTNVTVLPSPEILLAQEDTIVEQESYLIWAEISGGNNVEWTTSGDGTFAVYAPGFAEYFPGTVDFQISQVEITASMAAVYPCNTGANETLVLNIYRLHEIQIPAGWTGFSTFIHREVCMQEFFAPIMDDLIIVQSQSGVFWPQGGLNTMSGFSCQEGYRMKMSNAVTFSIVGPQTINTSVQLHAGWNLIPVISCGNVDVQSILDQLGNDLIVIKDVVGSGVVWPSMGIQTLYTLQSGKAYMFAIANSTTLDYSMCTAYKTSGEPTPDFNLNSPWDKPEETTISHIVAFSINALNDLQIGDVIGAFNNNGLCTGLARYAIKETPFALAIYGDESLTPETEGMTEGEMIRYKVYRNGVEILELSLDESSSSGQSVNYFTQNGLSVVDGAKISAAADFSQNSFSVFPNPTTGKFQVETTEGQEHFVISVSDLNGKILFTKSASETVEMDMSGYPRGFYLININNGSTNYTDKLILK